MDKDALLAAMYDQEAASRSKPAEQNTSRARKIRVGVVEYEVPTVEYLRYLEQLVLKQNEMLTQQKRMLDRLNLLVHGTRSFVRRQTDNLADLQHSMAYRISR